MKTPTTIQEVLSSEYYIHVPAYQNVRMTAGGFFEENFGINSDDVKIRELFKEAQLGHTDLSTVYEAYIDSSTTYCVYLIK